MPQRLLVRPYPAQGKPLRCDLYISLRRILTGFLQRLIQQQRGS